MMQITLLAVGKCRQAGFREAAEDYARRLKHYAAYEEIDVREARAAAHVPIEDVRRREGERLLEAVPANAHVVVLDPTGRPCTSEAFARRLSDLALAGKSRLAFLIGGAFGLSAAVRDRADWRLSLSSLTFPHELARVILLEQIYRAFTILRGEKYHK